MDIEKMKQNGVELRESGFNCAQSVLCALGEYTNLPEKTALAIAGGFGGGAGCGELCGTISGALMAVGIVNPYDDVNRPEDKKAIRKLAAGMCREYIAKYGCCRCKDLKANKIECSELVAFGIETAVNMIENNKNNDSEVN